MAKYDEFSKLSLEFAELVDFAAIYVEEAHPIDGWQFQNAKYNIYQHKKLEDRMNAAAILAERCPSIPVFIDLMENRVSRAFGALPERLFIVFNNEIVYEGGMGPFSYDLKEVKDWIANYTDILNSNTK